MKSKNIIITGTSRGIGLELVKLFAQSGHQVLALSRNDQPCKQLNLPNVTSICCDITLPKNTDQITSFIKKEWKTVDILINNSGKIINKLFSDITVSDFEEIYKVNIFGAVNVTKAVLPFMKKGSHVVNISSMGGVQGSAKFSGLSAYSSSKGALITLTELLAEEYKEAGISFNVLALGAVQTEMLQEAFPGYQAPTTAQEMATYIKDFSLTGNQFYNGKILQVSNSTP